VAQDRDIRAVRHEDHLEDGGEEARDGDSGSEGTSEKSEVEDSGAALPSDRESHDEHVPVSRTNSDKLEK
jgi:hypothetical protein